MSHFQTTPLQEGMLINQQLNPGHGFDLEQVVVNFPTDLHPDQLVQGFRASLIVTPCSEVTSDGTMRDRSKSLMSA